MNKLARLTDLCTKVAQMVHAGMSDVAIASALRLTRGDIRQIKQEPEFKQAYYQIAGKEYEPIERAKVVNMHAVEEAIDKLVELMRHSTNESVQLKAAQDLLDRAGLRPQETPNVAIQINQIFDNIKDQKQAEAMLTQTLSKLSCHTK